MLQPSCTTRKWRSCGDECVAAAACLTAELGGGNDQQSATGRQRQLPALRGRQGELKTKKNPATGQHSELQRGPGLMNVSLGSVKEPHLSFALVFFLWDLQRKMGSAAEPRCDFVRVLFVCVLFITFVCVFPSSQIRSGAAER